MLRRLMIALVAVAGVAALTTPAVAAPAKQAAITVSGTVAKPASYSADQLDGMAKSTYPVTNPFPGHPPRSPVSTSERWSTAPRRSYPPASTPTCA